MLEMNMSFQGLQLLSSSPCHRTWQFVRYIIIIVIHSCTISVYLMLCMVNRLKFYIIATSLFRTRDMSSLVSDSGTWNRRRHRTVSCLRIVIQRLQMNIFLIILFMNSSRIIQNLMIILINNSTLIHWMLIITSICQIFSSSFWNYLIIVFRFGIGKAIYRNSSIRIFRFHLNHVSIV